jgi:hypothetical protein
MISVVIPTHDSEQALVHTLAALVPGALHGLVREVIVTDAGSSDATGKVADVAGCRFVVSREPLAQRLRAAAETARGPWLMFLRPGCVPEASWVEETEQFMGDCGAAANVDRVAVFHARAGRGRPVFEALALLASAFAVLPKPSQGLLIAKSHYQSLGGHEPASTDPERALLRRIGRRRIAALATAAAWRGP